MNLKEDLDMTNCSEHDASTPVTSPGPNTCPNKIQQLEKRPASRPRKNGGEMGILQKAAEKTYFFLCSV